MLVYVVLYDRPIYYNNCCETEIVDIFKYREDAEECARENENYRIEDWFVSGT